MTKRDLLEYEIYGSWWSGFICADWAQWIVVRYFHRKVDRKTARYVKAKKILAQERLK